MSSDFAVFDPAFAPKDAKAFRAWYDERMDWDIGDPDPQPELLTAPLRSWYAAMIAQFPDLNRGGADDLDAIDYSFTKDFIYCSMAPARADEAWELATSKAKELGLGTYDCMSDDGRNNQAIVSPGGPLANDPTFLSRLFGKATDRQ